MLSLRNIRSTFSPAVIVRTLASSSQPNDSIQKLFVDKIRDYAAKSKTAPSNLVDSNPELLKKLKEDMDRVANAYGIKDEANIANLNMKFEDTIKLDPINLK